jgi:antitoxin (DNA-binding transcriptional repressor) of toxin-antitoxin stability system
MNQAVTQRTITQRELENESAAIMDAVEAGETMILTRNGAPIAELKPIRRPKFTSTAELKAAFAVGPDPDYAQMRADIDEYFGEDRIGDDE